MPEVSVITIAKREEDLAGLRKSLKSQTFKDFEFIYSTKRGIPQAWNEVIDMAKGKIIIVTESDAMPLTNRWLEDMVASLKRYNRNDPKKKTVIRGMEVNPSAWCWCNFASYASTLKKNKMDESFRVGEDTELFARLRNLGYKGVEVPVAPVLHSRSGSIRKMIKNNFWYGILLLKIQMKYGQAGFKSTFRGVSSKDSLGLLKRELGIIVSKITFLLGALIGFIMYFPLRKR
jgi:glycosyltransferase involved in cell wall biosynthesis